ncbi:hypothetical protein FDECE_16101 [Fusarium decemcellulare]|nr:hypothetical protein FDECE_16101 [Fusarium decemcellulare]
MSPQVHASLPARSMDKRHASTNLDDTAQAHKKICLQGPEPEPCKGAFNTPMSDDFWSATELARDNASRTDILMSINEGNDAEIIDGMDESTTLETSPDTCFGVVSYLSNLEISSPRLMKPAWQITLSVTSSFFRERETTTAAVDMRSCGSYFKLYTLESSVYAGIVTEPTLSELLTKHSVTLSAKLIAPTSPPRKGKRKPVNTEALPSNLNQGTSLRVMVYGSMREASQIGRILSASGHYLQHPSPQDIQQSTIEVEYFNPHYLLRPGCQMPRLEDLEIDCEYASATSTLDETSKAQLMGIFDSAGDLSIKPTAEPSPRLRTRLQEHQLTALAVMSEKECFNISSRQCPSLWQADDSSRDGNRKYRHRITGQMVDNPPFIAGGILADARKPYVSLLFGSHVLEFQMRVALYHGPGRQRLASHFQSYDIILTTYQTLRSDCAAKGPLFSEEWFRVVLDEG